MNKKNPKVVVGVCTYNRCNDLKRCLNSLTKLDYTNFEIVVVDNNSTDDTKQIVESFANVKYISEKHQGVAYARNVLLDYCGKNDDYLGMIDDDETVPVDWIKNMLRVFEKNIKIVAVGGAVIPKFEIKPPLWMPNAFHAYGIDIRGEKIYDKIGIVTGNAFIKISALNNKNIKFNTSLGYNGDKKISGEDNEFFDKLIGENDLCGFSEYAYIIHHIDKKRMSFKWFTKRYFYEGVTQYYRFGKSKFLKYLLQFPLRFLNLIFVLFTFNRKKIALRFFKLVMNTGVIVAPFI